MHLACTSHVPRMYLALRGFVRRFCIHHSSFCLRPSVALGGFARPFCIHHSVICLPPVVALRSHWGRIGVALGWL
jgi:hypothetical protein